MSTETDALDLLERWMANDETDTPSHAPIELYKDTMHFIAMTRLNWLLKRREERKRDAQLARERDQTFQRTGAGE